MFFGNVINAMKIIAGTNLIGGTANVRKYIGLKIRKSSSKKSKKYLYSQWLIAQLVERSLSVMKDPGSNLGEVICSFGYCSVI
jgi:hypothetical protein